MSTKRQFTSPPKLAKRSTKCDGGFNLRASAPCSQSARTSRAAALDPDPHALIWGGNDGGAEFTVTVQAQEQAMVSDICEAFPGMALALFKDELYSADFGQRYHASYGSSEPFVSDLLSAPWLHIVVAIQRTHDGKELAPITSQTLGRNRTFISQSDSPPCSIGTVTGLWPLAKACDDKSARNTAGVFAQRLYDAVAITTGYVWNHVCGRV